MTNNLLHKMTLDNRSGKYFLLPQTGSSQHNFANPPYFGQFDKLYGDRWTTQNLIGFVGMDTYPAGNGLNGWYNYFAISNFIIATSYLIS